MAKEKKPSTDTARTVKMSGPKRDDAAVQARIAELRKSGRAAVGYAPTFVFEMPGDEVSGKIVDIRENVGTYESGLCVIERAEGSVPLYVSVWFGADLALKITKENLGSFVTILYVEDLDTGLGNPMRCYEVFFT